MIQSLYLDGRGEPLAVGLYGVALQITKGESPPILAPLERVRRVCCWGRVQWAGEALIACAAHAVPIGFLAGGRSIAYFLPTRPPPKAFGALIGDAVLNPEWRDRLQNWVDSETARALATAADATGADWSAVRLLLARGDTRQALRAGVRIRGGAAQGRRMWSHFQAYLHGWATARLRAEALPMTCFGYSSDKPNLPDCFTRALSPLLVPSLIDQAFREAARRHPDGPIDRVGQGTLAHRCALAFDRAEPMLDARFPRAFRRFEQLVRDCAEEVDPCPGS